MQRGEAIYSSELDRIRRRTDRMFANLFAAQWLLEIVLALWMTSGAWPGDPARVPKDIWSAVFLGGLISAAPSVLALTRPGEELTRHAVAAAQMMTSALLIHLSGGRIETHFHIFGSLAFLALYRDAPVLLTALFFIAADHGIRGLWFPQSVYGVAEVQPWRFLEHAAWVVFEDLFLIYSVFLALGETRANAERQAELEDLNRCVAAQEKAKAEELIRGREAIQRQFLANMSHDLRTPIASIKGYAETLRSGGLDDARHRRDFVETIEKNADRLNGLVENLFELARLDGNRVETNRAEVPIGVFMTGLLKDLAPQTRRKRLALHVDIPEVLRAHVDPDHLWRILQNLVMNAVKFSPRSGALRITAAEEGGRAIIRVSDDGPGIPLAQLPLIFERFHCGDRGSGKESGAGAGIGLAIVKGLIELNGGEISAGNHAGGGALFEMRLPLAGSGS